MLRRPYASLGTLGLLGSLTLATCGPSSVPIVTDGPPARADGATERATDSAMERADAATERADAAEGGYGDGGPCMPGLPRCDGDFGYRMCQQDGTWGLPESCAGYSMNGTTSFCADLPVPSGGTWGTCVDPACWYWLGRDAPADATAVGICLPDGTIDQCSAGGTLSIASCAGACTEVTMLDGRALGYCAPACAEGARECLGGPFYRSCAHGRWSASAEACAGSCNPIATGALPDIRCGGACDPGTSRCRADLGAIESCQSDGTWKLDRTCLLGSCVPAGPQAECETACTPGAHRCAFDGAATESVCDTTGEWMPESACATGLRCRFAGQLALGCVTCLGPDANGGNAFGAADSRCDADGGVEICADDHWASGGPCPAAEECATLSRGASTLAACAPP